MFPNSYRDYACYQRLEDLQVLGDLLQRHQPKRVIELGTDLGGMSAWLADQVQPWGGHVWSFDLTPRFGGAKIRNLTVEVADLIGCGVTDTKTDPTLLAQGRANPRVVELIEGAPSPLLLYCDNGHKATELRLYAPLLRVGDLCAVHDYGTEVDAAWAEAAMAAMQFDQEDHARFEAVPDSMTRLWVRRALTAR